MVFVEELVARLGIASFVVLCDIESCCRGLVLEFIGGCMRLADVDVFDWSRWHSGRGGLIFDRHARDMTVGSK